MEYTKLEDYVHSSLSLLHCLLAGAIVLLSLAFLMPAFYYIPKAALAAVIICAVAPMADYRVVAKMWRTHSACLLSVLLVCVCLTCISFDRVSCTPFHRARPAALHGDVHDEFLAGAVRHHRRRSCVWGPAPVQHGETTDNGNMTFFAGWCVSVCLTFSLPENVAFFLYYVV